MLRLDRKTLLALGLAVLASGGLSGCSAWGKANPMTPGPQSCGDPCEHTTCPSAFRCTWNAQCVPRCDPMPMSGY